MGDGCNGHKFFCWLILDGQAIQQYAFALYTVLLSSVLSSIIASIVFCVLMKLEFCFVVEMVVSPFLGIPN